VITRYVLPVLSGAGLLFAILFTVRASQPSPVASPVADPARAPFEHVVAGSGLVEAASENVALGAPLSGLVKAVHVTVGDLVSQGQVLFELDDRALRAELGTRSAALAAARAELQRLQSLPRPEDVPPLQARLAEAEAGLADARAALAVSTSLQDPRALSQDERDRRRFAVTSAEARVAQAAADLALLRAGAWAPDLAVAQAAVDSAQAQVHATEVELDRLAVRAPQDGRVLQVKVRAGEYAPAGALAAPLMLFGSNEPLHVRVDIDENDAWRVHAGAPATASARGNANHSTPLEFVRFEPYVVPKRSLTGESTERVDTRVLQVVYRIVRADLPLYVGQQMDVFIEAEPLAAVGAAGAAEATGETDPPDAAGDGGGAAHEPAPADGGR